MDSEKYLKAIVINQKRIAKKLDSMDHQLKQLESNQEKMQQNLQVLGLVLGIRKANKKQADEPIIH